MGSSGTDQQIAEIVKQLKPAIDASLDCVAVVDAECRIVYANLIMKAFLRARASALQRSPYLYDLLKLVKCEKCCHIKGIMKNNKRFKYDGMALTRDEERHRISMRAVPLSAPKQRELGPIAAMITVRDMTPEIVLQAKYQKLLVIVEEQSYQVRTITEKLEKLRNSLRFRTRKDL